MKTFTIITERYTSGDGRVSNTVDADRYEIRDNYLKLIVDEADGNITKSCVVALYVPGEWKQLYIKGVTTERINELHDRILRSPATEVDIYSELFHAWLKEHDKFDTFMKAGKDARVIINEFNEFYEAMD